MPEENEIGRERGEQPLARIMAELGMKPRDLVAASGEQLTHNTVARAAKGRWLTAGSRAKVRRAVNAATGKTFSLRDLFNY